MRLLIGALLLAASLSSLNTATACPVDLAPCEEIVRSVNLSLDQQINGIILASPAFDSELDIRSSVSTLIERSDVSQVVLLNHEDDFLVSLDHEVTADVTFQDDLFPDEIDPLSTSTALGEVAIPTRRFLLEDGDLIDIEHTGGLETASATSAYAQARWAQDGYEDR